MDQLPAGKYLPPGQPSTLPGLAVMECTKVLPLTLYRTSVIARVFFPKQSPVLQDFSCPEGDCFAARRTLASRNDDIGSFVR
jgi:hypothetical protein